MLVLSRRPDEQIILPTVPAVIKVISTQAGLVRLGIEAPADVPILREELTHDRLRHVAQAVGRIRSRLSESDPDLLEKLDGLEEEIRALRQQILTLSVKGREAFDAVGAFV